MNVKNIALVTSLAGFAVGFSDLQENIFFWMGRPVGAIAFIVFLTFALLESETTVHKTRRGRKASEFTKLQRIPRVQKRTSDKETCAPALTTAAY